MMGVLILVIDDERLLCRQLEKALSQEGYNVVCAFSAQEGIEVATKENPAVVLLDLRLPDGDGLAKGGYKKCAKCYGASKGPEYCNQKGAAEVRI